MRHTRLPDYVYITRIVATATVLAIAGCEHSEPKQEPQTAVVLSAPAKHAEAVKRLDLSLDKIADEFIDTQPAVAQPDRPLITPTRRDENQIEFGGNLLTDASVENYVDSIDGAKVSITFKTR
jgi:hypothetical protein